ncbi:hypothetical protein Btru_003554 [Bulinus truncatus]|nr:hypothetical protein Btru_003554 [Bulinus truncatus]
MGQHIQYFYQPADQDRNTPAFRGAIPTFRGAIPTFRGAIPTFRGAIPTFRGAIPTFRRAIPTFRGAIPTFRGAIPTFRVAIPSFRGAIPTFREAIPTTRCARIMANAFHYLRAVRFQAGGQSDVRLLLMHDAEFPSLLVDSVTDRVNRNTWR